MSTDTSRGTFDPPVGSVPQSRRPRHTFLQITAMTAKFLDEVREQQGRPDGEQLRAIDLLTIRELQNELAPELSQQLQSLALPWTGDVALCDAELRTARAQLADWLDGLLTAMQTAEQHPHLAAGTPAVAGTYGSDDTTSDADDDAIRAARRTLLTAITRRIAQQHLNAAQAASLLHLTGPRVTRLFAGDVDEFSLDELAELLPRIQLTLQVGPAR